MMLINKYTPKNIKRQISFLVFAAFFVFQQALAHSTHDEDVPIELYSELLQKISSLQVEDVDTTAFLSVSFKEPGFFLGKKWIKIDNAFWDLTNQITQIYLNEIKRSCHECELPRAETLDFEIKNLIAQGWFEKKASQLKDDFLYRYVGEFTGLGARYGVFAGAAKVAGELVEDALLVVFKMPGAHFLCEAITLFISYNSKTALTYVRALTHSRYLQKNSIATFVQLAVTSYYVRRSLKRAQIHVPEFSVNLDELDHLKEDFPENKWLYKLTNRHRIDEFIKILDKKIKQFRSNNQNDSDTELAATVRLRQKIYNGRHMKRFLLLKKHNSSLSISKFADHLKPITRDSQFWILELKNETLGSILSSEAKNEIEVLKRQLQRDSIYQTSLQDSISKRQIMNFSGKQEQVWIASLFESLDRITNAELSRKQKYFQLKFFESFIGDIIPHFFREIAEHTIEDLPKSERNFREVFLFQWKMNSVMNLTDQFTDFLATAAMANTKKDVTLRYHIRDYFTLLLDTYEKLALVHEVQTLQQLKNHNQAVTEVLNELKASQFWNQKKTQPTIIPEAIERWGWGAPRCENIYL